MYERILVPVDGSPTSNAGLAEAMKLAKLTGATIQLLHAVDGAQRMVLGSDAERIVRKSRVPVLMVRGTTHD